MILLVCVTILHTFTAVNSGRGGGGLCVLGLFYPRIKVWVSCLFLLRSLQVHLHSNYSVSHLTFLTLFSQYVAWS